MHLASNLNNKSLTVNVGLQPNFNRKLCFATKFGLAEY